MMKRLLDEEGLQGDDQQLADLLRAAAPFEVDPFRKRRILVRALRGQSGSKARFWLRPAVGLTLLISGTAAAAIGHRYVSHGSGFFGWSVAPSATSADAPKHAPSASAPRHVAAEAPSAPPETVTAPEAAIEPAPVAPAASTPSAPKGSVRPRPDASEDPTAVVEAIQALRAGRDPARAQGLLDDYLKTHPHGVLSGDALALSIEAASARNDPRASDYARRYLALYPKGKYRTLAKRALDKQH